MKNDYVKQKSNYPRTLINMYGLMGEFEPTRVTLVARGRNKGLNFGNVVVYSEGTWNEDNGRGSGTGGKMEFWHCGGYHLKRNCPKRAEEKEKTKKDDAGVDDNGADGKTEFKGGQLHIMFTSLVDVTSGTDFSDLGEDN